MEERGRGGRVPAGVLEARHPRDPLELDGELGHRDLDADRRHPDIGALKAGAHARIRRPDPRPVWVLDESAAHRHSIVRLVSGRRKGSRGRSEPSQLGLRDRPVSRSAERLAHMTALASGGQSMRPTLVSVTRKSLRGLERPAGPSSGPAAPPNPPSREGTASLVRLGAVAPGGRSGQAPAHITGEAKPPSALSRQAVTGAPGREQEGRRRGAPAPGRSLAQHRARAHPSPTLRTRPACRVGHE